MNILLNLDKIGPQPRLYIKKNMRFASFTGALFTILLGILSILVVIGLGYNLLARKNPTSLLSKELNEQPIINSTEPFFVFAPFLPFGARFENLQKKFVMKFKLVNSDGVTSERKNNVTVVKEYWMVPCNQTKKFNENYFNISKNLMLPPQDYYCIPDNITLPIEGKFGSAKFTTYGVYLDFCAKILKNDPSCYSVEEVQKMHSKINMHFIYLDSFIDSKDYDKPIKYIYNGDITLGNTNAQRQDIYFFKNVELFSDLGWIMESYDVQKTIQLSYITNSIVSPAIDPLYFFIISIDNIKDVYFRKYLKIQEIIANAGGFIKFCLMMAIFLNNFLTSKTILESIYLQLIEKYEEKIEIYSRQVNSPVQIFNIKRNYNEMKKNNNKNQSQFSYFEIKNSEQFRINLHKLGPKCDSQNPFTQLKSKYKNLTFFDKLCAFNPKKSGDNINILNLIEDNLKSTLNIENMIFRKNLHDTQYKLLYAEEGYKLLKMSSLLKYLKFQKKKSVR